MVRFNSRDIRRGSNYVRAQGMTAYHPDKPGRIRVQIDHEVGLRPWRFINTLAHECGHVIHIDEKEEHGDQWWTLIDDWNERYRLTIRNVQQPNCVEEMGERALSQDYHVISRIRGD